MNILPSRIFTLKTTAPLVQVKQQLAKHIDEPKLVRWNVSYNHAPYQGTISDVGFEIRRIIHYRNSFLPNIQGRFELLPVGTAVHIRMQLHPLILAFMAVWLGIWYSATVPMTFLGEISPLMKIGMLGIPLVACGVFLGAFHYEAERSQRDLTQIVTGQGLSQQPQRMPPVMRNLLWGYVAIAVAVFLHYVLTS
ncbi:MAG: hypothetical protein AAF579_16980 [Cyanobacteria bacterium P01_C01_bin.118]